MRGIRPPPLHHFRAWLFVYSQKKYGLYSYYESGHYTVGGRQPQSNVSNSYFKAYVESVHEKMLNGQNNILKYPEKGEVGKYTHFLLWAANLKK